MKFLKKVLGAILLLFIGLVALGVLVGQDSGTSRKPMTEQERLSRITKLVNDVQTVPASDYAENFRIYDELSQLDPANEQYKAKATQYKAKRDEAREMEQYPEHFVKIAKFSWRTEGFGNIMEATFTIKNTLPFDVKDLEIKCVHSAPSGTVIDSNTRPIYQLFKAGQSRTIRDFNMGFINNQANRSGCGVIGVTRVQ